MRRIGRCDGSGFIDVFAGGVAPMEGDAAAGSWVEVELEPGRASLVRVLAAPGGPGAALYALAEEHGLDPILPPACEAEAAAFVGAPGLDDPGLIDLRHLAFVTIDYASSRDLDQALYVEADGTGWTVWYALADGAYYVRPGTELFTEALRRGTTAYLPGLIVTMLPRALCEGIMSLNAGVDRRALVFRMAVDAHGRCTEAEPCLALVRSRAKLAYSGVQAMYDGDPSPTSDREATAGLQALAGVGEALLADAESRDVVQYRRREIDVRLDEDGLRFVTMAAARLDSERYNEQISLLTNSAGARWLASRAGADPDVHAVYRVHAAPDERSLGQMAHRIKKIARHHGLQGPRWVWDRKRQSLGDFVRTLPLAGPNGSVARAIQRQVLVTSGRSGFQAEPARHHGVGSDAYARFTAPMREVIGCFMHKEVAEALGARPARPLAEDETLRQGIIDAALQGKRRQRKVEKQVNHLVLDRLFRHDLAEAAPWREGVLLGAGRGKLYVQLDDPAIDVHVYLSHLGGGDEVETDGAQTLVSRGGAPWLRLGDQVKVRTVGLDTARDRWRLEIERV